MDRWQGWRWRVAAAASAGAILALVPWAGAAETAVDTRPERGIVVYTEYAGVAVPDGKTDGSPSREIRST